MWSAAPGDPMGKIIHIPKAQHIDLVRTPCKLLAQRETPVNQHHCFHLRIILLYRQQMLRRARTVGFHTNEIGLKAPCQRFFMELLARCQGRR